MQGTREALERAVYKEIGRQVKLDLRLRRIKCKSIYGKNATTNIYSVVVDSRQVSEAVKGLRAVLNKTCQPPARRHLSFTTKNSIDPDIQRKNNNALVQHHEVVVNERKFHHKIGAPINSEVVMKDGRKYTLQKSICLISNKEGQQLFTGVERMDRTNSSLITLHKKNLKEGTQTLQVLPKVLQGLLSLE